MLKLFGYFEASGNVYVLSIALSVKFIFTNFPGVAITGIGKYFEFPPHNTHNDPLSICIEFGESPTVIEVDTVSSLVSITTILFPVPYSPPCAIYNFVPLTIIFSALPPGTGIVLIMLFVARLKTVT